MAAAQAIQKVRIVDDDPKVREGYGFSVEDLSLEPCPVEGPLPPLQEFLDETVRAADCAIMDYKLTQLASYSTFNGAEPVAELVKRGFPAILCSNWVHARLEEIRGLRAYIPAILTPDEVNAESLRAALELCMGEIRGEFIDTRRPWRTLVAVEDIDESRRPPEVYFTVVAWGPEVITMYLKDLPAQVDEAIRGGRQRLHAKVNLGAETVDDIYFKDWSL